MPQDHMKVTIGDDALPALVEFCRQSGRRDLFLIADRNTYAALGERVDRALAEAGCDVRKVIFTNHEVIADAHHVLRVLIELDQVERTFVAVGSGTLTDITRFVSHRTRRPFISVPTAPSVDGFASVGAPLIVNGVKITYGAQAPIALYGDTATLSAAPQPMIAAGFADMLGKVTSVADWRIGALVWDEPYDETIAQRTRAAAQVCIDNAEAIGAAAPEGIAALLDALLESGFCMLEFGNSRPASGAEHHLSHFWEMKLLREGRPAILHGAKVGVATAIVAGWYDRVRALDRGQAADLLEASAPHSLAGEMEKLRAAYGPLADDIAAEHRRWLELTPEQFDGLKRRILENWDAIQAAAATVPPAAEVQALLRTVGGPVTAGDLGLSVDEQALAEQNGHYLRDRFTVRKLIAALGLE